LDLSVTVTGEGYDVTAPVMTTVQLLLTEYWTCIWQRRGVMAAAATTSPTNMRKWKRQLLRRRYGCEVLRWACLYVCLFVCPLAYFKDNTSKLHNFWATVTSGGSPYAILDHCHVCPVCL